MELYQSKNKTKQNMELKRTISSIFFTPLLQIEEDKLKNNGFINTYIKDLRREVQYNGVYLLFKPDNLDGFKCFLDDEYERTPSIIDDYDYEDGYIVLVYELPEKFQKDLNLIKEGKYSKTSQNFQNAFPKTKKIMKSNGLYEEQIAIQHRIFQKQESLKLHWEEKIAIKFTEDMEIWNKFEEFKEVMDIDKIKQIL